MTNVMILQQKSDPVTHARPWPVTVLPDGEAAPRVIHGRPDASHLIGFQPGSEQRVTVFGPEAIADPASIVGLVPVYMGPDGIMFAVELPVESARLADIDIEALTR